MTKQTAVEFLIDNLHYSTSTKWKEIIEHSKAMEKEQIMNAWVIGLFSEGKTTAEEYYNQTFKK